MKLWNPNEDYSIFRKNLILRYFHSSDMIFILKSGQVQIKPMILNHTVPGHFSKDIAAELHQCGIDKQVLLFQRFGQRMS